MSDGLHIRWRETAPDRGLLSFALSELEAANGKPIRLQVEPFYGVDQYDVVLT